MRGLRHPIIGLLAHQGASGKTRRIACRDPGPGRSGRKVLERAGVICQAVAMQKSTSPGPGNATIEVATVRIELSDTDPLIWREVAVPVEITLKTLHDIVQAAMGWHDSHLWTFNIGGAAYGLPKRVDDPGVRDAGKAKLQMLLNPRKTRIHYLYDFGDSWEHVLTISGPRAGEAGKTYPLYLGGEQNAPPDDCGGIPGFYESLQALADPNHPEHEHMAEWFGDYDPAAVDHKGIQITLNGIAKRLPAAKRSKRLGPG